MTNIEDVANYIALMVNTEPKYKQCERLDFRRMKYLLLLTQVFSVHTLRHTTFPGWFEIGVSEVKISTPKLYPKDLRMTEWVWEEGEFDTPKSDYNPRKVLTADEREIIRDALYALRGWKTADIHALIIGSLPPRLRPTENADYTQLTPADLAKALADIELRYSRFGDGHEGTVIAHRSEKWCDGDGDPCEYPRAEVRENKCCRCYRVRWCRRD